MSFTVLASRRDGDAVEVDVHVPPECPYFHGHFPRAPILPGVALLELVTRLGAAYADVGAEARGVRALRLRGAVEPDAELTVRLQPATNALGFAIRVGGKAGTQGRLLYDDAPPPSELTVELDVTALPEDGPAPPLPHEGPARMIEAILARDAESVICSARVPAASAFRRDDLLPGLLAIELAAQASAAHGEDEAGGGGAAVEAGRGFVVSVREAWLARPELPADERFVVQARCLTVAPPLRNYEASVWAGDGSLLCCAQFGTWVPA